MINLQKIIPTSAGIIPPNFKTVSIYFSQKGKSNADAESFYRHYQSKNWKTKCGKPIKNWMTIGNNWIWNHRKKAAITLSTKIGKG